MNMKKFLLVFFILVGHKASAVSFEDCVCDVLKEEAVAVAPLAVPLILSKAGFTPGGVAAGSLAAWWHASIGETGHSAYQSHCIQVTVLLGQPSQFNLLEPLGCQELLLQLLSPL